MVSAQTVEPGFFPLDEELGLLPGSLTPSLSECAVRLAAWIPSFGQVEQLLQALTGAQVSEASVRRQTEAAGAAYVTVQSAEVERIERDLPQAAAGVEKLILSVDGAMVPLVGGEWAEVKTLVIGEVGQPVLEQGEWVVHSHNLSYFSRLADAKTFRRLALVETERRGVTSAKQVGAVSDGADWEQGFIDLHRMDALRILDLPHAAEHLSPFAAVVQTDGQPEAATWLPRQVHDLKHDGPTALLVELETLAEAHPEHPALAENWAYLHKRQAHMQYPSYIQAGWPIGSGMVESANKRVVEERLKGPGMHWAPDHVNPMLALRNIVCNDRWHEAWPQIWTHLRTQAATRRTNRQLRHHPQAAPGADAASTPPPPLLPQPPLPASLS